MRHYHAILVLVATSFVMALTATVTLPSPITAWFVGASIASGIGSALYAVSCAVEGNILDRLAGKKGRD